MKRINLSIFLLTMFFQTTAFSATINLIDNATTIWLGDDSSSYQLQWNSSGFDLPGLDLNEPVTVHIEHYGVYPSTPRDSLWVNGIRLFDLGQSSWGSWGEESHTFDPRIGFMESNNIITIYSEGLDHIPEWGYDDFMIRQLSIDYTENQIPAPVPEPATIMLLGTGLAGLIGSSRKNFKKE
jgi:hypothetical protein